MFGYFFYGAMDLQYLVYWWATDLSHFVTPDNQDDRGLPKNVAQDMVKYGQYMTIWIWWTRRGCVFRHQWGCIQADGTMEKKTELSVTLEVHASEAQWSRWNQLLLVRFFVSHRRFESFGMHLFLKLAIPYTSTSSPDLGSTWLTSTEGFDMQVWSTWVMPCLVYCLCQNKKGLVGMCGYSTW